MENKTTVEKVDSNDLKCPECGGPLKYDPNTVSLKCDFCATTFNLNNEVSDEEFSFEDIEDDSVTWKDNHHIIKCKNCGAENIIEKIDMSIVCPFCGSTEVVEEQAISGMRPNRVIPFRFEKEAAVKKYQTYLKKRFFAPRKIKKTEFESTVNGIYLSSWTYDSNTFSAYKGVLGKDYTVVVGSGKNRHTETRIRWFKVSGTKDVLFDDVLVNSGTAISQKEIDALAPFKTNESIKFSNEFLAGFKAEHYSIGVKDGFNTAKKIMDASIRNEILRGYSYDHVDYLNVKTSHRDVKYKYVLLPIWIGLFTYNKKNYRFLVNGETGKVTGKYPYSPLKILMVVLAVIILVVGLIYLFMFMEF